jgi:hypothetical protein
MNNIPATNFIMDFPHVYENPQQEAVARWHLTDGADNGARYLEEEQAKKTNTAMDVLNNSSSYTMYRKFVKDGGFEKMFSDPERKLTIFLASDRTLAQVPEMVLRELDSLDARSLVAFSTLDFPLLTDDMRGKSFYVSPLSKQPLYINGLAPFSIFINQRMRSSSHSATSHYQPQIIHPNMLASNAVFHILSMPLIPRNDS